MISDKTHLLYSDTCGMFSGDRGHQDISLFLFSLCQRRGAARNCFTASSDSLFHPPLVSCLLLTVFFLSCLPHIYLSESSHLSLGFHRILLPCSSNSAALFGSLSSAILSTCPAHCNLLLTSLSVSSLNSTIIRLSALVTLAIFHTQLFSHTCSLCCCSSVSVKVSVPYRNAGVIQVIMILHFNLFEIRRTAITPSTALHAFAPACSLRRTSLSPSSRLRTLPLIGTRNCPVESVSSPPAR